jgi:hypothetical protein
MNPAVRGRTSKSSITLQIVGVSYSDNLASVSREIGMATNPGERLLRTLPHEPGFVKVAFSGTPTLGLVTALLRKWQSGITQRRKDAKNTGIILHEKSAAFGFLESPNEPPCCNAHLPCFFATSRLCVRLLVTQAVNELGILPRRHGQHGAFAEYGPFAEAARGKLQKTMGMAVFSVSSVSPWFFFFLPFESV